MKHIYIVLIKAHTGLGQAARMFTHYDYTHIAVCTDKSLTDFLTYSRKRHYLPFDAGFMHEYRDYYAFGQYRRFKAKVFKIPVGDKCYEDIMRFIAQCENDDKQMFNLFSMITMPILHGFRIYKAHNCMSFTAKVIELSSVVKMNKPYYKYSIKDMDKLLSEYVFYEGYLRRIPSPDYPKYMKRPAFSERMQVALYMIFELTRRMLFVRI